MVANFKARWAFPRARHEAFIVRVKEGIVGDLVSRYEMEECFWMGFLSHGEKHGKMETWNTWNQTDYERERKSLPHAKLEMGQTSSQNAR